jgi:RHS repeat-associated protein
LGKCTTSVYDQAGRRVATINPLAKRATSVYDAAGRLIASIDPLGNRTTTVYDKEREKVARVNPLGKRSTSIYDTAGRLSASIDPLNNRTTQVYDKADRVVGVINALGKRSTSVYDAVGRLVASVSQLGNRTTLGYDKASRLARVTNPLGNSTTTVYDDADRPIATVNPLLNRISTTYDAAGRAIRVTNPLNKITTTVYDAADRLVGTVNPLLQRTTYGYDAASQQISVRDANNKITTSVFDLDGRPQATVDSNGNRVSQAYDAASRRIALVDPRANRTTLVYNDAGWQTVSIDPLTRRTTQGYDANGRQTLRLDARGNRTTYVYDDDDRLTGRRYPDGSRVTFAYTSLGDRSLMQDANGRTTFAYDAAQRLASVVNPALKRITYGYDGASERTLLIEPGSGRFSYTWDVVGRIDHLINPQANRTTWTYDAANRTTAQRLANGIRVSYGYDDADRLLKLANIKSDGTTISSFYYALDSVGNRTRVVEFSGDRVTWVYDNTYQLKRETRSGLNSYDITYSYDPAGNRKTMLTGGVTTTYTCDAANQLNSYQDNTGTTNISYDTNGNQTGKIAVGGGRTTNTWDFENRLTKVVLPAGTRNTFVYDADGKRVQKQDSTGTTKPIWDLSNILEETDGSDVTQAVYTQAPRQYGDLVSQFRAATQFFLSDGLGSTDRLTDSMGNVTDNYVYKAFGSIQASGGTSTNPFRYVGRLGYYINSDLATYYLRARYYDPSLGRFLSPDPFGHLDALTLYTYVLNLPILLTDPSGLWGFDEHVELTESAVNSWANEYNIARTCREYVRNMVVCCNLAQDWGPNWSSLEMHYNRPFRRWETEAEIDPAVELARLLHGRQWDRKYQEFIEDTLNSFYAPGAEDCRGRLEALGKLTHAWQDFYGHAIRGDQGGRTFRNPAGWRRGRLGSENSAWPGFSAFADPTDPKTGDPDNHFWFMPCSYVLDIWFTAEHPPISEPLDPRVRGPEYQARLQAARQYTNLKLISLLEDWYQQCSCYCPGNPPICPLQTIQGVRPPARPATYCPRPR